MEYSDKLGKTDYYFVQRDIYGDWEFSSPMIAKYQPNADLLTIINPMSIQIVANGMHLNMSPLLPTLRIHGSFITVGQMWHIRNTMGNSWVQCLASSLNSQHNVGLNIVLTGVDNVLQRMYTAPNIHTQVY